VSEFQHRPRDGDRRLRVALIDDHPLLLAGLVAALTAEPDGFRVVGRVRSVEDFEALADLPDPDVVILDLDLPGGLSGADAVAHLAARYRVVVLTQETDPGALIAARAAGAAVCIGKNHDPDTIRSLVTAVAQGEVVVDPLEAHAVRVAVADRPEIELTDTEGEVLELLVDGLSNAAIQRRLGVASKTLQTHITNIYRKLRDAGVLAAERTPRDRAQVVDAHRRHAFRVRLRRRRRS
jgi:DNA-binding NarL/FixJ family response regulator